MVRDGTRKKKKLQFRNQSGIELELNPAMVTLLSEKLHSIIHAFCTAMTNINVLLCTCTVSVECCTLNPKYQVSNPLIFLYAKYILKHFFLMFSNFNIWINKC